MSDFDLVIRGGTIADGTGGDLIEADIGVKDGRIAAIGKALAAGAEEIDAQGPRSSRPALSMSTPIMMARRSGARRCRPPPATASPPSSWAIAASALRRAAREDHAMLINVMEGVEDIPGVVMTEGLPWDWETFPEYLDRLDAASVTSMSPPTCRTRPLRVYAMGERGARREAATEDDLARMRALTKEAMEAGAIGFATSRLSIHKTADGGAIPTFEVATRGAEGDCGGHEGCGRGHVPDRARCLCGWDKEYPK